MAIERNCLDKDQDEVMVIRKNEEYQLRSTATQQTAWEGAEEGGLGEEQLEQGA